MFNDLVQTFVNKVPINSSADVEKVKGFYRRVVPGTCSLVINEERVPMDAGVCVFKE